MKINLEGLYNFHYTPVGLPNILQYDRNPLIFILDIKGGQLLGVNLHWIAKVHRADFISQVDEIMGKTKLVGKKRERARLLYTLLKKPKFRNGLQAIRRYYLNHMSGLREVPRTKWALSLGVPGLEEDIRKKTDGYKKLKTKIK